MRRQFFFLWNSTIAFKAIRCQKKKKKKKKEKGEERNKQIKEHVQKKEEEEMVYETVSWNNFSHNIERIRGLFRKLSVLLHGNYIWNRGIRLNATIERT